jgi:hypothetical protein
MAESQAGQPSEKIARRIIKCPVTYCLVIVSLFPSAAQAQQCAAEMRLEVLALQTVVDSVTARARTSPPGPAAADSATARIRFYQRARAAIQDDGIYYAAIGSTAAAAPCLAERRATFRSTAISLLPADSTSLSEKALRDVLHSSVAAVLSTRYSATDRVGVLFGIGFSFIFNRDEPEIVKVIERDTGQARRSYVVRKETNRAGPVAVTGIGVRFRDVQPGLGRLLPAAAFGSVQFGIGEDPVRGAALGLGWPLAGDAQIIFGLSLSRIDALRDDLVADFRKAGARLELPVGENLESIVGARTASTLLLGLAVPVALRSAFGGTS